MSAINEIGKWYQRPWGRYKTLDMAPGYQVKVIEVNPGGQLSLQKHFKRAEHWVVVAGTATVTHNENTLTLKTNDKIYIDKEDVHRLENFGDDLVRVIEVQIGDYLGEDDIVRLEDVYQRN